MGKKSKTADKNNFKVGFPLLLTAFITGCLFDDSLDGRIENPDIEPINSVPVLEEAHISSYDTMLVNTLFSDTIRAMDKDGDPLEFALGFAPAGMRLYDSVITWTPSKNDTGLHQYTILVQDSKGATATQNRKVYILGNNASNTAPVFISRASKMSKSISGNSNYKATLLAYDPDEDNLLYRMLKGPFWLTIAEDGSISAKPTCNEISGDTWISVTAEVRDEYGLSDTLSWVLSILRFKRDTATANAPFQTRTHFPSVVFKNKMWISGGQISGSALNDVWYTENGKDWKMAVQNAAFKIRCNHGMLVFKDKMWIIAGDPRSYPKKDSLADVWNSEDGVNWNQIVEAAPFCARGNMGYAVFKGKMWIVGGTHFPNIYNDVWSSEDGINWNLETANPGFKPRYALETFVFENKLWITEGIGANSGVASSIWNSEDGRTWAKVKKSGYSPRYNGSVSVYKNMIWGIGGNLADKSIAFSNDGKAWEISCIGGWLPYWIGHETRVFQDKLWIIGGRNMHNWTPEMPVQWIEELTPITID